MFSFQLDGEQFTVGRTEDCEIHVRDSEMSRRHARLERDGAAWRVVDLGSTNGVFVNGALVQSAPLEDGDVLRVGTTLFRYFGEGLTPADSELPVEPGEMVAGPGFDKTRALLDRASTSTINVLIIGETGTGKELAARHLHLSGPRAAEPFVAVNCGAIPADLMESELFGHRKGAFTGASADRPGYFRQAQGGTLLLDEIGELPLDGQPKLLRVLQERRVRPVGGTKPLPVDLRVVCATNRDLAGQIREGTFRPDLFARVASLVLRLPPLHRRREDIPLLVQHFLVKHGAPHMELTVEALELLCCRAWPHNIRQLEGEVSRALVLAGDETLLEPEHFERDPSVEALDEASGGRLTPPAGQREETTSPGPDEPGPAAAEDPRKARLEQMLRQYQGDTVQVAEEMGLSRSQLYRRAKKLGIVISHYRP